MPYNPTPAHVAQYSSNVRILAEETRALLRQICEIKTCHGGMFYGDRLKGSNTVRRTGRHSPSPYTPVQHDRRRGWLYDDEWGEFLDKQDDQKVLVEYKGKFVTLCVNAFNRSENQLIIDALGGPAYSITTPAAASGAEAVTVVNNYDAGECRLIASDGTLVTAGSNHTDKTATSLTIAKLALCGQLFDEAGFTAENGLDLTRYFISNHYNKWQLLQTTEVKSVDYNTVKALAEGKIDTFMGFKFLWMEDLPVDPTETDCINSYAVVQGAIALGVAQEVETQVYQRGDYSQAWYCYGSASKGATRQEGPGVIEINLKKAA